MNKNNLFFYVLICAVFFSISSYSQTCTNFAASYDGVRLSLSGLNTGAKVKVSISHNGGVTYTDITSKLKLTAGQNTAVYVPYLPVEKVLMEGLDMSNVSVCSKTVTLSPTRTKASIPTVTIMSKMSAITIKTDKGTLQMSAAVMPLTLSNRNVKWTVKQGTGKATINTNGLLTACSNGTVTVTATSELNNTVSSSMDITISGQSTVCNIPSVNEISSTISFKPNPVKDVLSIDSPEEVKSLSIYKVDGTLLKTFSVEGIKVDVNVSDLTKGLYIIRLQRNDGYGVHKFIKE